MIFQLKLQRSATISGILPFGDWNFKYYRKPKKFKLQNSFLEHFNSISLTFYLSDTLSRRIKSNSSSTKEFCAKADKLNSLNQLNEESENKSTNFLTLSINAKSRPRKVMMIMSNIEKIFIFPYEFITVMGNQS